MPASPCTCFRLRRATRRVSQLYDQHLAEVGLSLNEYSILRRAGTAKPLGTLAASLGMDRSTLSRNLQPMLAAGWLQALPGEDARQRHVVITASGRACLRRALPRWRQAQQALQQQFGNANDRLLNQLLDALEVSFNPGASA